MMCRKKDLKTGDVVVFTDGTVCIVFLGFQSKEYCGDCLISVDKCGWEELENYTDDLKYCFSDISGLDIVEVRRPSHPYDLYKNLKGSE